MCTAILWFIYVAYLMLRGAIDDEERRARLSAVVGIFGMAGAPVVYFSIRVIHVGNHPVLLALAFVVFVAAGYSAAGKPSLSKKEVKALIASAKTREDHLKLAEYYKGEAVRLEAEAKDHDEMAEMYRKNPTPMAVKHPEAFGEGHCKEIARRYRESAAKTQELAAMHEQLAATAEQKQP